MAGHKLRRLFAPRQSVTAETARLPEGLRIYAIGDIHGRDDLLKRLHALIATDVKTAPPAKRRKLLYLGDYVDRGLHSREVIDILINRPLVGFETVYLRGNHDQQLLDFLKHPASGAMWLRYGGDATLYSYGVRFPDETPRSQQLQAMSVGLREALPPEHLAFFEGLEFCHAVGDYFFAHAGINPERRVEDQTPEDLMWIREEFLECDDDLGRVVVHGHSVTRSPEVRENRIGIDTGAVFSNTLTCLVLDQTGHRFISTANT